MITYSKNGHVDEFRDRGAIKTYICSSIILISSTPWMSISFAILSGDDADYKELYQGDGDEL